ncbi:MAG TPA: helix-turn-helix domain-containing protein [bacterium]|nr:helix-turn-helix domain-containing protein [bacterium]
MEEVSQITMIEQYLAGAVRLKEICERFKLHRATVWRKIRKLRESGREGLVHGLCGKPSNNLTPPSVKERICGLYEREYRPLGVRPWEFYHRVVRGLPDRVSYSTIRRWLGKAGK